MDTSDVFKSKIVKDGADILKHVQELKHLFSHADQDALEKALQQKDLSGACSALGVSPASLELLLKQGHLDIERFAARNPEVREEAIKRRSSSRD